jgi:inner membrane protein
LSWARFPVLGSTRLDEATTRVSIADLRYHLNGSPTLTFVIDVDRSGLVKHAHLDRGGTPRELWQRLRQSPD